MHGEWIGWAPLEQVTTDQFLGVLFDCLSSAGGDTQGLRLGACACLKELADKGMGSCERLYLLRRLKIIEVVERFGMPGGGGAGNGHRNVNMNGNGGGNHTANSSSHNFVGGALSRESIAAAMAAETSDDEIDFAEALASLVNAVTYRLIVCRDVLLGLSKDDGGSSHRRSSNAAFGVGTTGSNAAVSEAEAPLCVMLLNRARSAVVFLATPGVRMRCQKSACRRFPQRSKPWHEK